MPEAHVGWATQLVELSKQLAEDVRVGGDKPVTLSVLERSAFDGSACSLGEELSEDLILSLFGAKAYLLVERHDLDRVLAEAQIGAERADLEVRGGDGGWEVLGVYRRRLMPTDNQFVAVACGPRVG